MVDATGKCSVMLFSMTHLDFPSKPVIFTELTAPEWLSSANSIKGSTMDMRWFFDKHVLTLEVGKSVDTDFRKITRVS
jgi:hypothetical protein